MTVSVITYINISNLVLLACSYLNLSKNSSLNAFVLKADAKVRTFSELPKLFRSFFQKVFFEAAGSNSCSFVQYFNSSAFLSRKRVQKYCFTAYTPNHRNTFLQIFCNCPPKSLTFKQCRTTCFYHLGFNR